ncbi:hypothetical protein LQZ19_11425 [Treponema primitia]|uniref:hypothetical protein n=1 Tax=Treponema primitia TaxID=88058 RepID=UPI00397F9E07
MANIKTINVKIENSSWIPPHTVPPKLYSLAKTGRMDIDLDCCLLFFGILTKPPITRGFTLADCWAWLRYPPAFITGADLRFCSGWADIDSHQKTVASDELGVAFTTWALLSTLDFQYYADTNWVINKLKTVTTIKRSKRGPSKTPDYIAYDLSGEMSVLECKGGQTNQKAIWGAIEGGKEQKSNVKSAGGKTFVHTLVAGMFIPQSDSSESALLAIADPDYDLFKSEIEKYSPEQILNSARQVAIAKELSLFGFTETAVTLVTPEKDQINISKKFYHDIENIHDNIKNNNVVIKDKELKWSIPVCINNVNYNGVRFTGEISVDELIYLTNKNAETHLDSQIAEKLSNNRWVKKYISEDITELKSPFGARYKIEWLRQ